MSPARLARELGFFRERGGRRIPDGGRAGRAIGITAQQRGNGDKKFRRWIGLDLAEKLCDALSLEPVDVGI